MAITCNDIFGLPAFEKIKLVAGRNGLNRIISWVHVMEYPEYCKWLKGGELLMITGTAIKGDKNALLHFVKDLNSRNLSGLVINIGPYMQETPKELIELADSFDFPIFEIPFDVKLIDISQSVCKAIFMSKVEQESMDAFIKDIIFGDINFNDEVLNRAIFYGYNPRKVYNSFVIQMNNYECFVKDGEVWDEEKFLRIKQDVEQIIIDVTSKWNRIPIYVKLSDSIIVMVPVNDNSNSVNAMAEEMLKSIRYTIPSLSVSIGIGSCWRELKDLKFSVQNAQKALRILKVCGSSSNVINYNDIGIYRLLFEMDKFQEMKAMYQERLGKLLDYDAKNSTDLVKTLEVFVEEGGNLGRAAEVLYVHRNTLKYRVRRIQEILQCDLRNINDLFNFNLALKIGKFLRCMN
ncbi:MAG: PucR family transcriptional regulator ligand-binding domain-containing protein [Bacillota bacterium]|nr:PucR family transcriptional regulator ligand-binding domain-containing protein [Bacillota bacterium]